jgi:hypothetical protein
MAQVKFKSGKVLFSPYRTVSFCDQHCDCGHHLGDPSGCVWPTDVFSPPCVIVKKQDFDVTTCTSCVTTIDPGNLPLELWYDGAVLYQDDPAVHSAGSSGIRLYGNIQLDTGTCRWVLTIRCKEGAPYYDVWVGEKTEGKTAVGTYVRTGGCDNTEQITVQ